MDEIRTVTDKYDESYIGEAFQSLDGLNRFALIFCKDVASIYDCLTRIKNVERNPSGFSLDDAPVLDVPPALRNSGLRTQSLKSEQGLFRERTSVSDRFARLIAT